jgi:hypothetical protein
MQITGVVLLVGLSIILFEVSPEKSVWSIPVTQTDEHIIAVPASGGLTLLLGQKQEAYKTLIKEQQRFWKRILIVDDDVDVTITFKAVIEESNNDVNKRIEVDTSNDPIVALLQFKPNFYDLFGRH